MRMNLQRLGLSLQVLLAFLYIETARCAEDDMDLVRHYIVDSVKTSQVKSLLCNPDGGQPRNVVLTSADDKGITILQDGAELRMNWKQLKPLDIYYLGRGLLGKGAVAEHFLMTRVALKLNLGIDMDKPLEQLEIDAPKDIPEIEKMRAQIKATFAPVAPAAPPVQATPASNPTTDTAASTSAPAHVSASKLPAFNKPLLYDTPEADAVLAATQILPPEHPFNQDISKLPLHPNSAKMIASVGLETILWPELDMNYVVVPPDQKRINVKITPANTEADPGPFPFPDNAPIEEWPMGYPGYSLEKIQREGEGDRHVLVVDPGNAMLYEFFYTKKTDAGWQAAISATFELNSCKLRPLNYSSADAAGMPIFPAVVKYFECERGIIPHAMRFAVKNTRKDFIFPARHCATNAANPLNPDLPRMGERFRLRADFDVSGFPPHVQAILNGLKKYGMLVADNTGQLGASLSIAPDPRIKGLDALKKIKFKDFEVVQTPTEGKR